MRAKMLSRWLLAGACLALTGCPAAQPVAPPPASVDQATKTAPTSTPVTLRGTAMVGGAPLASANVQVKTFDDAARTVGTTTTQPDGTFTVDLDASVGPNQLVRVFASSGAKTVVAAVMTPDRAAAKFRLTAYGGTAMDERTTFVYDTFNYQLRRLAAVLQDPFNVRTFGWSGDWSTTYRAVLERATENAETVLSHLGSTFTQKIVERNINDYDQFAPMPKDLADQVLASKQEMLDVLTADLRGLEILLLPPTSPLARDALSQTFQLDLGNGDKISVPPAVSGATAGAPPAAAPATQNSSSGSSGGGSGGGSGGSGGGGSGGGSGGGGSSSTTNTTTANLNIGGNLAVPGVTPLAVTVGGSLRAPAAAQGTTLRLLGLVVRTVDGATAFDFTFSGPVFGWEDPSLYGFAAADSALHLPTVADYVSPTTVAALADSLWHLAQGNAVTLTGDVDPKVVHVNVANTGTAGFLPTGTNAVRVHVAPGIKDQDGRAMSTLAADVVATFGN